MFIAGNFSRSLAEKNSWRRGAQREKLQQLSESENVGNIEMAFFFKANRTSINKLRYQLMKKTLLIFFMKSVE